MKKAMVLAAFPVAVLLILGGFNVHRKAVWKEPTDGITWEMRPGGLTATRVDTGSEAYLRAGIRKGDILYSINKNPVGTRIDIAKNIWLAAHLDQMVIYEINRDGLLIHPSFYLKKSGTNPVYFYLALVGLTTVLISLIVFINSRDKFSPPYVYFYLLSILFYSLAVFSPTGALDGLDTIFYWLDKAAFLLFPPLLLHFFLIFPQRKKLIRHRPQIIPSVYVPAVVFLLSRIVYHALGSSFLEDAEMLRIHDILERLGLLHFSLFALAAAAAVLHSAHRTSNVLIRKQLRFIVSGLGFGILPFSIFYMTPFLAGRTPSSVSELTVLLMALVPLAFAYSISRYKLIDLEVLIKKAATLVMTFFVIATFYYFVSSQTRIFSENRFNVIILGILAILLGSTLFTPLKKLFQALFDRVIYRRSYEYRKTLFHISKEIGRERDLQDLSQSLLDSIANALSLRTISLLLADEQDPHVFSLLKSHGDRLTSSGELRIGDAMRTRLQKGDFVSYYALQDYQELKPDLEACAALGYFHILPLKVEDKIIGLLGMGRKIDGTYLTSEDWELLATISASVALALENAYLYNRESIRAREMQRLKDYSENIIESLTVGVAVIDDKGMVIGWNRVMESLFRMKKQTVMNRSLSEVIGDRAFSAVFPSDTQQDYRLLSEIPLEIPRGPVKVFDIARTPLLDNRMQPYGTIIVFEDVTEKINLQRQLLTSEKLASIGLLSAGVAHEINTPLTGISSYVQILQKKLTDTHNTQILEKIETQTDRVGRIIKNLLSFARNPSDESFHKVDLKQSLEEILSLIDYKLKNMNIVLELDLDPVPPVNVQGERLQQVFINIFLNALDAMPDGGRLGIELKGSGQEVVIRIRDSGTGIKPEHLPHIFDPFFTTKGIGKGTGLGLSISYGIVQEHAGHISVQSELNKGTVFTIAIPMDARAAAAEAKHSRRE